MPKKKIDIPFKSFLKNGRKDLIWRGLKKVAIERMDQKAAQEEISSSLYQQNWIAYVNRLIELGDLQKKKTVLEVGCGWGRILVGLAGFCPHLNLMALDIRTGLLHFAKQVVFKETGISIGYWTVGDAENLPFRSNTFDMVYCIRVLHYLISPRKALREFFRLCKKDGVAVVFLPNKWNILYSLLQRDCDRKLYFPIEVVNWFEESGFSDVQWGTIGFIPSGTFDYRSKILGLEYFAETAPILSRLGGIFYVVGRKR